MPEDLQRIATHGPGGDNRFIDLPEMPVPPPPPPDGDAGQHCHCPLCCPNRPNAKHAEGNDA